jgi:hypothetical protein
MTTKRRKEKKETNVDENDRKDIMICNITEVFTRNQAGLDLSETSIEVFLQLSRKNWPFTE